MRIALVIDSLQIGGAERHVTDLAVALQARGHDVLVACSFGGPFEAELRAEDLPVFVLGHKTVKRRASATYACRLRRLVQTARPDIVHAHLYSSAVAAALATALTGVPLIISEHSLASWEGSVAWRLDGLAHRRSTCVIVNSATAYQRVQERTRGPSHGYRMIANSIPTATSAYDKEVARQLARSQLRMDSQTALVGVVARLQPEKGVDVLLDAAARVAAARPDAAFVVIGDGPECASLMCHSRLLGLTDRVHFMGEIPNARLLIPAFDVLAVPSRSESAPLVVLEAMAAGVPIVATSVGGIPEQVRHEIEGLLLPPEDPPALSESILTLLSNPNLAHRLSAAGRQRVLRTFPYDAMVDQHECCYREVLGCVNPGRRKFSSNS